MYPLPPSSFTLFVKVPPNSREPAVGAEEEEEEEEQLQEVAVEVYKVEVHKVVQWT